MVLRLAAMSCSWFSQQSTACARAVHCSMYRVSSAWMHARLPPPYGHAGLGCGLDPWPRIRFVRTQRNHNLQYDTVPHRVGPHSVTSTNHNLRCRCRCRADFALRLRRALQLTRGRYALLTEARKFTLEANWSGRCNKQTAASWPSLIRRQRTA